MKGEKYDLILPLGGACSCAELLNLCGLRYASYPLDWLIGGDLRARTDLVVAEFAGWFEAKDFEFVESPRGYGKDIYRNKATGISFLHDFPTGVPFDESFALVRAKYAARERRILEALSTLSRILLLWVKLPTDAEEVSGEQIAHCLSSFRRKYPNVCFDLRILEWVPGMKTAEVVRRDGATVIRFDYKEYDHPAYAHAVVLDDMKFALADVRARDRRSLRCRVDYWQERRAALCDKFCASNLLDLAWAKVQYKLYRHFQHALERRGMRIGRT